MCNTTKIMFHTVRWVSRHSNRHAPGFPEAQYAFKILMIH